MKENVDEVGVVAVGAPDKGDIPAEWSSERASHASSGWASASSAPGWSSREGAWEMAKSSTLDCIDEEVGDADMVVGEEGSDPDTVLYD